MYISPINLIQGLINILEMNKESIQECLEHYLGSNVCLNIFKGMRKSLPLSSFPCIEFEPTNGSIEWTHTSAQTGEYTIQCTLTVNCDNDELGAEYISELTRRIIQIYNYPGNMTWIIPNEYQDNENPVYVQFGNISSVNYYSAKDGTIRISQWDWTGRVLEVFPPENIPLGPCKMNYKKDILI